MAKNLLVIIGPTGVGKTELSLRIAEKLNLPVVATNECYFKSRENYYGARALWCIADGTYLDAENGRFESEENFFKSPEEMVELSAKAGRISESDLCAPDGVVRWGQGSWEELCTPGKPRCPASDVGRFGVQECKVRLIL